MLRYKLDYISFSVRGLHSTPYWSLVVCHLGWCDYEQYRYYLYRGSSEDGVHVATYHEYKQTGTLRDFNKLILKKKQDDCLLGSSAV